MKTILVSTSVLFLVFSLLSYVVSDGWIMDRGIKRLTGSVTDPNHFVTWAAPSYIFFLSTIGNKDLRFRTRFLHFLVFLLSITCISLTASRGGILAICLGTGLFVINPRVGRCYNKTRAVLVLLVSLAVLYLFAVYGVRTDVLGIIVKRLSDLGGSGRVKIWTNAFKLFSRYPFFGIGLYNFQYYNLRHFDDYHYAHNTFLEVLVEGGIVGGLLFLSFIVAFILDKPQTELLAILKLVVYTQLLALCFLSGILAESVYLSFALYKGIKARARPVDDKRQWRGVSMT